MIERATAAEALAWAIQSKVALPDKNRMKAINLARTARGLRPFVIVGVPPDAQNGAADEAALPARTETVATPLPIEERASRMEDRQNIIQPPLKRQTASDLRDVLFQEMTELRAGTSSPQQSHAVSKLAAQIVSTFRLDILAEQRGVIEHDDTKTINRE